MESEFWWKESFTSYLDDCFDGPVTQADNCKSTPINTMKLKIFPITSGKPRIWQSIKIGCVIFANSIFPSGTTLATSIALMTFNKTNPIKAINTPFV